MTKLIPILLYHSVDFQVAPEFQTWSITPDRLDAHLKHIVESHYTPITVTQLVTALSQPETSLPDKPIVITFDDGFMDFYTNAMPILDKYKIPVTLYVASGYVGRTSQWLCLEGEGQRPMLDWNHIAELLTNGIEIGAHTQTHPQLDTLPFAEARKEIFDSKQLMEAKLGQPVLSFAYPHGYYNARVRQFVQDAGFTSACGVKEAMSSTEDDVFSLARIVITDKATTEDLISFLKGTDMKVAPIRETYKWRLWRAYRWTKAKYQGRPCLDPTQVNTLE